MITRPTGYISFSEDSTAYNILIRLLDENFDPVIDPPMGEETEGEEIYFTTEEIMDGTLIIEESMCAPGSLTLGGAVAGKFECQLLLPYEWAELYAADATYAEIWFVAPNPWQSLFNDEYRIRKGQYRFSLERTDSGQAKMSGYDDLANDYYNTPLTQFDNQTLGSATTTAAQALSLAGITANSFTGANTVVGAMDFTKDGGFYHATRRDILSWVCELIGSFARIIDGVVTIVKCFASSTPYVIDKMTGSPYVDVSHKTISGVIVEMTSGQVYKTGSDGNYIVMQGNPFLRGNNATDVSKCQTIADNQYAELSALQIYPFDLNWMGDPALQPGDMVQFDIQTASGTTTIQTWVTNVSYSHNGTCVLSTDKGQEFADEDSVYDSPSSASNTYGYNSGDTLSGAFFGYGYTTSQSGVVYVEIPLTKPINASTITITSANSVTIRGTTGLMLTNATLSDMTIVSILKNPGGFRINLSGVTTHFTAQTPISFVGNMVLSFS